MKEQKQADTDQGGPEQARPDPAEEKNGVRGLGQQPALRPVSVEQQALRPDSKMQMEAQSRKSRGRLNRETMNRLGKTLEAYYDDVRKEGVPDRFKDLLKQLEERKDKGSS
jgi:hypothetical protein